MAISNPIKYGDADVTPEEEEFYEKYRTRNGSYGATYSPNGAVIENVVAGTVGVPYGGHRFENGFFVYNDGQGGFYTQDDNGAKTKSDFWGSPVSAGNEEYFKNVIYGNASDPEGDTPTTPKKNPPTVPYDPSTYAKNTVGTFDQYLQNNAKLYGELLDKQKQYANDTYESAVKYADAQAERDRAYYTTEAERGRTYYDNQLAEAQRQNEIARQRAAVDADSAYRLSRATYGTDAEALGRMGLSGSGYGSYADSQAYLASRQQKVAADAEANAQLSQVKYNVAEGKYGVDQAERAGLYNVESNLGAAKYNADQTRRQTLYGAEEEYTKNIMANEEKRATYNEAQREKAEANRAAAAEKVEAKLEAEKAKAEAAADQERQIANQTAENQNGNAVAIKQDIYGYPEGFNPSLLNDYVTSGTITEEQKKDILKYYSNEISKKYKTYFDTVDGNTATEYLYDLTEKHNAGYVSDEDYMYAANEYAKIITAGSDKGNAADTIAKLKEMNENGAIDDQQYEKYQLYAMRDLGEFVADSMEYVKQNADGSYAYKANGVTYNVKIKTSASKKTAAVLNDTVEAETGESPKHFATVKYGGNYYAYIDGYNEWYKVDLYSQKTK